MKAACFVFFAVDVFERAVTSHQDQDQDQDSSLVKRRNDNHSPGPVIRE